jgi:hypothetical protein
MTPDQAEAALRGELAQHASNIDSTSQKLGMQLTPGQRNALVSFSYNTGAGPRVLQQSGGDLTQIPGLMAQFTHVTNSDGSKSVLPGLVNRRTTEIAMFGGNAPMVSPNQPLLPVIPSQPAPLQTVNNPVASLPVGLPFKSLMPVSLIPQIPQIGNTMTPAQLLAPVQNNSVRIANSLPSLFIDPTVSGS